MRALVLCLVLVSAADARGAHFAPAPKDEPPRGNAPTDIRAPGLHLKRTGLPPGILAQIQFPGTVPHFACEANGDLVALYDSTPAGAPDDAPRQWKIWRLHPRAEPHPAQAIVDKLGGTKQVTMSRDGQWLSYNEAPPGPIRLLSLRDGRHLEAPAPKQKGLRYLFHRFSTNGRQSYWGRLNEKGDLVGTAIFDSKTGRLRELPDVNTDPWTSEDGSLTEAGGTIVDATGKSVYPDAGKFPLVSADSIAMSADGHRIAVPTEGSNNAELQVRIYELPGWKGVRVITVPKAPMINQHELTNDGLLLVSHGSVEFAPAGVTLKTESIAYEIASGERLYGASPITDAVPDASCRRPRLGLLLPATPQTPVNPIRIDIHERAPWLPPPIRDARKLLPDLALHLTSSNANLALAALQTLTEGKVTRKAARAAIAKLPTELTAEERNKLAALPGDLGSDRWKTREAASEWLALLIGRTSPGVYTKTIHPVLLTASKSPDLEVARRARRLLEYRPRLPDGDILESRLQRLAD